MQEESLNTCDKKAIRQRHKNKAKYSRGYKTVVEKETVVELPENWSRYDESASTEDETANFDTLSKEPTTSNQSFFKFKSEQSWDDGVQSQLQLSNYFTLDLTLLSEGIVCIPFAKRQDIDESLFSCADSEHVNRNIERNLQNYTKYINKRFSQKKPNSYVVEDKTDVATEREEECPVSVATETQEETPSIVQKKKPEEPVMSENETVRIEPTLAENVRSQREPKGNETSTTETASVGTYEKSTDKYQDDMDELLSLKEPEHTVDPLDSDVNAEDPLTASTVPKTVTTSTAVDLEQWLDDILDD